MLREALTRKSAQSFTLYENQITMWGCLYSHYTTYSSAVTGRALDVLRLIGGQDTEFSIRAGFPLGQKHLPYHRAGPRKLKFFKSDCRFLKIFVPPLTYGLVLGKLRLQVRSSRLSRPSKPLRQRRGRATQPPLAFLTKEESKAPQPWRRRLFGYIQQIHEHDSFLM